MVRRFIDFIRFPPPYQGPILRGRVDGIAYLTAWILTLAHLSLAVLVFSVGLSKPWPLLSGLVSACGTLLFISIVIVIHHRLGERRKIHYDVVWQWWLGPWDPVGRLVWLPVRLPEAWRAALGRAAGETPSRVAST